MARYLNDLDVNTSADGADVYLTEQSGVDKKITLNDIKDFVLESVFPIGSIYTQLPGKSTPSTLSYPGTWTNISSTYSGDFFRVEGGEASVFEAGEQGHAFQGHEHTAFRTNGRGGWESDGEDTAQGNRTTTAIVEKSPYGAPQYDVETRPVNQTIRIWERTA